jgi:hypothetical protein
VVSVSLLTRSLALPSLPFCKNTESSWLYPTFVEEVRQPVSHDGATMINPTTGEFGEEWHRGGIKERKVSNTHPLSSGVYHLSPGQRI